MQKKITERRMLLIKLPLKRDNKKHKLVLSQNGWKRGNQAAVKKPFVFRRSLRSLTSMPSRNGSFFPR